MYYKRSLKTTNYKQVVVKYTLVECVGDELYVGTCIPLQR